MGPELAVLINLALVGLVVSIVLLLLRRKTPGRRGQVVRLLGESEASS